jgi:serine/threonine protein kinase
VAGPNPAPKEDQVAAQRVGSVIKGKWHVDSLLGVGGMASVYAATHRNGQRAALKILHADFAREKGVVERFFREAYVSNKIGHPACVKVLDDDYTEAGEPLLVMELLEGETLRDLWKRHGRRVPPVQVLEIADVICDCLVACHAIGVIHRDLKPANIFITNLGETKVLDFGVAQFRSAGGERTTTGTALGTPAYMSPEQAMGLVDQLDGRADIFSVGAMIHALVTGQRINQGRSEAEALIVAATQPVPSVARLAPDLPIELIHLIDKALAFDRRNRFADAREIQAAIREVMAHIGGPVHAPSPVATPHTSAVMETPRAAVPAPPPPPPQEVKVAEDDPRVVAGKEFIKHLERLLPNVRQFGWEHPATDRSLRTVYDALTELLAKTAPLELTLRPYSLLVLGNTVWEPNAPWDAIPYNLFACGVRTLRMLGGLALDELRTLLSVLMLDPGRDLPPEDDIVTAFWEKALVHVEYDVVDAFAEGDAAAREAFFDEADRIEHEAADAQRLRVSRVEAQAMVVSTNRDRLGQGRPASAMALEEAVRALYANQLDVPADKWSERCVDAIVEGLLESAMQREPQLVLGSLRRSSCDLLVVGRIDIVAQLLSSLCTRVDQRIGARDAPKLKAALTSALFGAEPLDIALRKLAEDPTRVDTFHHVLTTLPGSEAPRMLAALRLPCPDALANVLLEFVHRYSGGLEEEIANTAAAAPVEMRTRLLEMLVRMGTPGSKAALAKLASVEDAALRMEVRILTATSADDFRQEVGAMLDQGQPLLRMTALRALVKHKAKPAWPIVRRLLEKPGFNDLGADERRDVLMALYVLSPEHGEPLLIEVVKKGGVFKSEGREVTRALAAAVLGEHARSRTGGAPPRGRGAGEGRHRLQRCWRARPARACPRPRFWGRRRHLPPREARAAARPLEPGVPQAARAIAPDHQRLLPQVRRPGERDVRAPRDLRRRTAAQGIARHVRVRRRARRDPRVVWRSGAHDHTRRHDRGSPRLRRGHLRRLAVRARQLQVVEPAHPSTSRRRGGAPPWARRRAHVRRAAHRAQLRERGRHPAPFLRGPRGRPHAPASAGQAHRAEPRRPLRRLDRGLPRRDADAQRQHRRGG